MPASLSSVEQGDLARSPPARGVLGAELLPGLYAWASTVLLPAFALGNGILVQGIAGVAGLLLLLAVFRGVASRWQLLGLVGFLLLSLLVWVQLSAAARVQQIDPWQAAVGGLGWALFALSLPCRGTVPLTQAFALSPRKSPVEGRAHGLGASVFAVTMAAAALPLILAWRVEQGPRALVAHVAACAAALAAFWYGAKVYELLITGVSGRVMPRLKHAGPSLVALAALLALGLALKVF